MASIRSQRKLLKASYENQISTRRPSPESCQDIHKSHPNDIECVRYLITICKAGGFSSLSHVCKRLSRRCLLKIHSTIPLGSFRHSLYLQKAVRLILRVPALVGLKGNQTESHQFGGGGAHLHGIVPSAPSAFALV